MASPALSLASGTSLRSTVSKAEWQTRVDLACAYRLAHDFGLDDLVWNHISARVPGEADRFLLNPLGWGYDEITASSLVKVGLDGKPVDSDKSIGKTVNYTGFVIHGAIHAARHDIACVMHTHSQAGMAVSALADGLLPVMQDAFGFAGNVAYHDYEGLSIDLGECARLAADLGPHKAMILRNHGLLTCGESVADAFVQMYYLDKACRVQLAVQQTGQRLHLPPQEVVERAAKQSSYFPAGEIEWPALMRRMERKDPGFKS